MAEKPNHLYYGDNLGILRERISAESVDLIYLDPPFNSNATYNVLFKSHTGEDSAAQIQAFDDTWHWSPQTETLFLSMIGGGCPPRVADALTAMRNLLGTSDMNAYIVMMTARLVELHRVLNATGSLYLHCDPTASHYLKVLLDAIFGPENFRNEIIWRRTGAHTSPKRFETIHDVILFYAKNAPECFFEPIKRPYTRQHVESRYTLTEDGRHKFVTGGNILSGPGVTQGDSGREWRGFDPTAKGRHWAVPGYLAEQMPPGFADLSVTKKLEALYDAGLIEIKDRAAWPHPVKYLDSSDGIYVPDIWAYQPGTERTLYDTDEGIDADVQWLGPTDPERLGFQTQKPEGLLRRVIRSSCPESGVVLDPFCGCGTTIDAAEKLGRRWIGIDITYLAIDLIQKRLRGTYGDGIEATYEVHGIPADLDGARALFAEDPFDLERWAVSLIDAQPNEKQRGDQGIDGRVRFHADEGRIGQVLVSVKGGGQLNPAMVRDLVGTVQRESAEMGILITLGQPTKGMKDEADKAGNYTADLTGQDYPKIQIVTVADLMDGKQPKMPTAILPYLKAKPRDPDQLTLDAGGA